MLRGRRWTTRAPAVLDLDGEVDASRASGDRARLAAALVNRAMVRLYSGQVEAGRTDLDEALAVPISRELDGIMLVIRARAGTMGYRWEAARADHAAGSAALLAETMAVGPGPRIPYGIWALVNHVGALLHLSDGRLDEALTWVDSAVAVIADEETLMTRARVHALRGDVSASEADLARIIDHAPAPSVRWATVATRATLRARHGDATGANDDLRALAGADPTLVMADLRAVAEGTVALAVGDRATAWTAADAALAASGDALVQGWARMVHAEGRGAAGHDAAALADVEAALALAAVTTDDLTAADALRVRAGVWLRHGDVAAARADVDEAIRLRTGVHDPVAAWADALVLAGVEAAERTSG